MSERRDDWADYAKGLGILLVVYGHVARGLHGAGLFPNHDVYSLLDNCVYLVHMPLFFFISGHFFWGGYKKKGALLLSDKVDKILIPYILWSLAQGVIEVLMASHTNLQASWNDVLNLTVSRAQFWFLQTLFAMFVLCYLLARIGGQRRVFWLLSLAVAALLYCGNIQEGFAPKFFPFLVFFLSGLFFSFYKEQLQSFFRQPIGRCGVIVVSIALMWVALSEDGFNYEDRGGFTLAVSFAAIFGIIGLVAFFPGSVARFFGYLGKRSFDIFVLHIIFGSGVRVLMHKFFGIDSFSAHLALGLVVGVAGALVAASAMRNFGFGFMFGPAWFNKVATTLK